MAATIHRRHVEAIEAWLDRRHRANTNRDIILMPRMEPALEPRQVEPLVLRPLHDARRDGPVTADHSADYAVAAPGIDAKLEKMARLASGYGYVGSEKKIKEWITNASGGETPGVLNDATRDEMALAAYNAYTLNPNWTRPQPPAKSLDEISSAKRQQWLRFSAAVANLEVSGAATGVEKIKTARLAYMYGVNPKSWEDCGKDTKARWTEAYRRAAVAFRFEKPAPTEELHHALFNTSGKPESISAARLDAMVIAAHNAFTGNVIRNVSALKGCQRNGFMDFCKKVVAQLGEADDTVRVASARDAYFQFAKPGDYVLWVRLSGKGKLAWASAYDAALSAYRNHAPAAAPKKRPEPGHLNPNYGKEQDGLRHFAQKLTGAAWPSLDAGSQGDIIRAWEWLLENWTPTAGVCELAEAACLTWQRGPTKKSLKELDASTRRHWRDVVAEMLPILEELC